MRFGTATAALALAAAITACGDGDGAAVPVEPSAGRWDTWVLSSGSEIRVPPPPRAGSRADRRDARALRAATRPPSREEEAAVRRWDRRPAVAPWLERAMRFVSMRPKDPPAASRAYALVAVAMEDAAIAAWHWKHVYRRRGPTVEAMVEAPAEPSYPSEHAALAGAASRVLAHAFPDQPGARLDRQAEEAARSRVLAGVSRPSDARAGLRLGRAVARRVIARARSDGFTREWDGSRPRGPGYWAPPPGSAARPVQPLAGSWRTWVLRSGAQLRPPPPPRFGSPGFRRQALAVMRAQEDLTPRQRRLAEFWEGGEGTELPPGIWLRVMIRYLRDRPLSTPRAARAFSLLAVAMADAGVAAWDAKYAYWYPRPENGIRDLGLDRRWKPRIPTPLFPAYVSGHAAYSSAAGTVLAHLFPDDADDWRARGREAGLSRIWGGIHWPVDNVEGARIGRRIGALVIEHAKRDGAER